MSIQPGSIVCETQRLLVRPLGEDDLPALLAVYGNARAMRFVGDGKPIGEQECRRWLEVTRENYATRGYGMFAIARKPDLLTIGFCGIVHPGGQSTPEIKYALLLEYWGKGFATEIVSAMLSHARRVWGLRRMIATVHADHHASQRVLRKVGMRHTDSRAQEDGTLTLVFEACAETSAHTSTKSANID